MYEYGIYIVVSIVLLKLELVKLTHSGYFVTALFVVCEYLLMLEHGQ